MKAFFGILIPICICSFIAFGISVAIFGMNIGNVVDSAIDYGESSMDITESYGSIDLDTAGYTVNLSLSHDNITRIRTYEMDPEKLIVSVDDNELDIDIESTTIYIGIGEFIGKMKESIQNGWDFSNFSNNGRIDIEVPEKIYKTLDIECGSGMVSCMNIQAYTNDIDMGSGTVKLYGTQGFKASTLDVDVGSGKLIVKDVHPEEYFINIGSGSFEVAGLAGEGFVDMGSGTGVLRFDEFNGDMAIDIGSGSLTVEVPTDISADMLAQVGSGSVKVMCGGMNTKLKDDGELTLGEGEYTIDIDMGSGSVKFMDRTSESAVTTYVVTTDKVA